MSTASAPSTNAIAPNGTTASSPAPGTTPVLQLAGSVHELIPTPTNVGTVGAGGVTS